MSMTRKQFLGSFAAGLAGLGALASGKVTKSNNTVITIPKHMSGYVRTEGLDENWVNIQDAISTSGTYDGVASGRAMTTHQDRNNSRKWLKTTDWDKFLGEGDL